MAPREHTKIDMEYIIANIFYALVMSGLAIASVQVVRKKELVAYRLSLLASQAAILTQIWSAWVW